MTNFVYDKNQRDAIKSLNNTLVIAGAGSGKTSTIVGRVNYLIKNNIYKENEILIISFTNESVNSLKEKITYNVDIKTFHKAALDIININNNVSIINNNYLDYIIDEYFNSFAIFDAKTNLLYKRIINDKQTLKKMIKTYINIYKCNYDNINYLFSLYKKNLFINKIYYKFILDIYLIYQRELESTGSLDLNDLIINATKLIKNKKRMTNYKHIIIDEFQDTSLIRFNFIISVLKEHNGKLFVVGDDYQSIYRFSGCDLSLFLNFRNYLPNVNVIHLNNNYRNSQRLIDIANRFILKNKKQIKKRTICHKNIDKPIKIVFYVNKNEVVNKVISLIAGNILILGRNNKDMYDFNIKENDYIKFLTIHKAKGLEEDNVILVNLEDKNTGFPSKLLNEKIISKILKTDFIIYEEERRLFYVALTRTKNHIYLLAPKYNYSVFIKELINDYKNELEFIHIN